MMHRMQQLSRHRKPHALTGLRWFTKNGEHLVECKLCCIITGARRKAVKLGELLLPLPSNPYSGLHPKE